MKSFSQDLWAWFFSNNLMVDLKLCFSNFSGLMNHLQDEICLQDLSQNSINCIIIYCQMKYYIAFAENSIEGHLESGPRKPQGDQEQIRDLISKLQNAKVCCKFGLACWEGLFTNNVMQLREEETEVV